MKFTRKQKGLFGIAFIGCLIILSWIGLSKFYPESDTPRYLPDRIYRIIKIVFGGDPIGPSLEPEDMPWELLAAKVLTTIILLYGGFKIIQKIFSEQYTLLRASFRRNHHVVVGVSTKGRNLLHSLKVDNGRKGIAIERKSIHTNLPSVRKQGHTVIIGNAEDARILLEAGIKRASHLILFLENQQMVVEIIGTVQRIYAKSGSRNPIRCYAHLRNPRLIDLVRNSGLQLTNGGIDLHFFNLHKIVARRFFEHVLDDFTTFDTPNIEDIKQLIIIGYGDFAKALVLQALRVFHVSTEHRLQIDIYSEHSERDRILFNEHYPKAHKIFPVNFHDFHGPLLPLIEQQELARLDRQTLLVVCNDDDQTNLNLAFEMLNRTDSLSFSIYTLNVEGKGLRSLMQNTEETERICFFGEADETYSMDTITGERQDILARAIHDDYQRKIKGVASESDDYTSDWPSLPEDAKDANRAQADHIPYKLLLTEKHIKALSGKDLMFSPGEVERLAAIEHNRWMAHRYLSGWDYGETRDDTLKLHPSLVPWEALSEGEKQKDRDTVLRIKDLIIPGTFR